MDRATVTGAVTALCFEQDYPFCIALLGHTLKRSLFLDDGDWDLVGDGIEKCGPQDFFLHIICFLRYSKTVLTTCSTSQAGKFHVGNYQHPFFLYISKTLTENLANLYQYSFPVCLCMHSFQFYLFIDGCKLVITSNMIFGSGNAQG